MKNSLFLLFVVLCLSSCSKNKELSFEERAFNQRQITLSNEFKNAGEFKITDDKVVFKSDSVILIQFNMEGFDDDGYLISGKLEYAYEEVTLGNLGHPEIKVWDDYLVDVNKHGSSIDFQKGLKESYKEAGIDGDYFVSTPFNVMAKILFSLDRKVPSQWDEVTEQLRKENNEDNK